MGPGNLYMELYNQKSNSIKWYFKVPQLTPYGTKTNPMMGPVNLYMELYNQKSNAMKW